MTVRIIVDDFGLYPLDEAEEVLTPEVNAVHSVRERIRYRLEKSGLAEPPLVLHMSSNIFRRFADLEGQPGLDVSKLSPRKALRERLGCVVPPWLDEKSARALGLLHGPSRAPLEKGDSTTRVMALIDPELLSTESTASFIRVLSCQELAFQSLMSIPDVSQWIIARLKVSGLDDAATSEIVNLFAQEGPVKGYGDLARCVLRERLDRLVLKLNPASGFALPPRRCSPDLAASLDVLPLSATEAEPFPTLLLQLLSLAERRVAGGELPAEALADFVFTDWPILFECLQALFEENPGTASTALAQALEKLNSESANALAIRIREYLENAHCDPLPPDASVRDVLRWSEGYFRYAIGALERGDEPDESVSKSFSRWVAAQSNRIIQSDYDWRTVSKRVEQELADGRVVILCMIDALGAIHNDLIELALNQGLDPAMLGSNKSLFAPRPTITEIGKTAVMTGIEVLNQSGDQEKILRERYAAHLPSPESLQIVRNWKDFRQALARDTRLLVCLDNRVDDDLHKCTDFRHHRERVRTVAMQLIQSIRQWLADARRFGKQASILITADHGATKVMRTDVPVDGTDPVERRILYVEKAPIPIPGGFHFEQTQSSGGGYLIPYDRVAYGTANTMLHGGLSPEEVLIPFVRIGRDERRAKDALRVRSDAARCPPVDGGWHVTLRIENGAADPFFDVSIVARAPFSGHSQPREHLKPYTEICEIIKIGAESEQCGRTLVPFELRFRSNSGAPYEYERLELDLDLGAQMIQRDEGAVAFDDMFD